MPGRHRHCLLLPCGGMRRVGTDASFPALLTRHFKNTIALLCQSVASIGRGSRVCAAGLLPLRWRGARTDHLHCAKANTCTVPGLLPRRFARKAVSSGTPRCGGVDRIDFFGRSAGVGANPAPPLVADTLRAPPDEPTSSRTLEQLHPPSYIPKPSARRPARIQTVNAPHAPKRRPKKSIRSAAPQRSARQSATRSPPPKRMPPSPLTLIRKTKPVE